MKSGEFIANKHVIFRRSLRGLHAFAGGFLLYLAFGGLAGFALTRPYTYEPSCVPFVTVFAQITSSCPEKAVNVLWTITLGIPRLLITFPVLAIAKIRAFLHNNGAPLRWLLDGSIWLLYSIPLLLLIWAGTLHWWKRHQAAATIILTLIVWQILWLGLRV